MQGLNDLTAVHMRVPVNGGESVCVRCTKRRHPMRRIVTSWMLAVLICLLGLNEVRADRLVLVAGRGTETDNAPAVKAKLQGPFGVDFSQGGDFYLVEMVGQRVCRVDSKGMLTVI